MKLSAFALALLLSCAHADLYMHNPRGGNNRLDERNRNRENNNRLFDSQNNNKGGYNQNDMEYYSGSILQLEWTNQHSCGHENNHCELVFQYMCELGATGAGIRDGQVRTSIPEDSPDMVKYGRHESGAYYEECKTRERNKGLFLADQNLKGSTAKYTRQNTNGQRSGFECPEERDYYPYWHPTPWVDIAILTDSLQLCPIYQGESQNVKDMGHCTGSRDGTGDPNAKTDGRYFNNKEACEGNAFTWVEDGMHKDLKGDDMEAPVCRLAPWSRDNHLGNGANGYANTLDWILPEVDGDDEHVCVLRMRYNISTDDYEGWSTFADKNGDNSPIQDNPTIDIGSGIELKLALNTDQYGRTFQDRSHTFKIKPRPDGIKKKDTIYNLNVKGQRGNIVQNYPSVEYDFSPSVLTCTEADYIHAQVTGSNTTPAGAGQGRESTDRHNLVQIEKASVNYPMKHKDITMIKDPESEEGFKMVKYWATLNQNDNEQDDAAPYQDFGMFKYKEAGAYHYMSSRTNNFTNRSEKGVINIVDKKGLSPGAIAAIVLASLAAVGVPAGTAAYGVARPESTVGQGMVKGKTFVSGLWGGGGSSAVPSGYAATSAAPAGGLPAGY